eukprot:jgi/Galph1/2944/GphlegSOOS_G1626.1
MQWLRQGEFLVDGTLHFTKQAFLSKSKFFEVIPSKLDSLHCIITGANSGIGFSTAEELAKHSSHLYLVCRNKQRGEEVVRQLQQKYQNSEIRLYLCDISCMRQVKQLVKQLVQDEVPINVLVHNAGCMIHEYKRTDEGYEMNFATNLLSVYYLTELLLPCLERYGPSRVGAHEKCFFLKVIVFGGMLTEPLVVDDMQAEQEKCFDGMKQYARNKRQQVALVEYWKHKYANKPISFVSMHPGWVDTPVVRQAMPSFYRTMNKRLRTPEQGADTIVWLASRYSHKEDSGEFFLDRLKQSKHLPLAHTYYTMKDMEKLDQHLRQYISSVDSEF